LKSSDNLKTFMIQSMIKTR